jgi:NAD-dependent dihydropyrimidine dehydrogenase PreA subunit
MYEYAKKIEIDRDKCNSCKTCMNSCFVDVYRWDDKEDRPIVAYLRDCVACFACEQNCPEQAIEVVPIIPLAIPSPF